MILIFILLFISIWSFGGVFWAIANDIEPDDIKDCTILTIIIGGPLWWFMLLLSLLINIFVLFARSIKISKIKPKKRETK